ncbi:MAG: A24 family peptidase [Defluviitaleaceae bacterium]|nr:A24 family peptidase [Defluviitaleaceae bacterium]
MKKWMLTYKLRILVLTAVSIAAFAACILCFGMTWMLPLALAVAAILLVIAVIDADTQEIPDKYVVVLIPLAAAAIWAQPEVTLLSRGIGFFTISLPMLVLALIINNAFGGGDIKLMAVCGFLLGWQAALFGFFVALVVAVVYGLVLRAKGRNKKGEPIAFGPALCAGVFVALLYGKQAVDWYMGFLFI